MGNITGAVVCICILLLSNYFIKKKRAHSHKVKLDNQTNPVYDEIKLDKKDTSSIELRGNSAYGQLN